MQDKASSRVWPYKSVDGAERVCLDDHFFDEDEVLDYLWYEEMRKEDEGPDKPQAGCFGILILLLTPASGLGCLLYSCL